MTDLTTNQLQRLLDQATAGPWTVKENKWDEIIIGNRAGHARALGEQVRFLFEAGHPEADTELAALAPQLAEEVLRMRLELSSMRHAWGDMSTNPVRTPVEQNLAAHVLVHIDSILGETND